MTLFAGSVVGVVAFAAIRGAPARAVARAFSAWADGRGSVYDLMDKEALVVIPGTGAHCGTYRKDVFLSEIAAPFGARFAKPPVPQVRAILTARGTVAVRADAAAVTNNGQAYANDYLFVFEMKGSRATRVTEFLDMTAFNAVWDDVEPERNHAG